MAHVKIAVIGAGSIIFTPGFINDLCKTEGLDGSSVSLMDINPDRLDTMKRLAERFSSELGRDLHFETTTDRQQALEGADFVLNTGFVQGYYHVREMRDVASKHGYYYQGEMLGPWYQLRFMLDVAKDMEQHCPDAWLIQSGNPVFDGCTLMTRETDISVCGLCHGHYGYVDIAKTIGIDPKQITWQAPGLNHNIWMTHFLFDGEDAYPLIDRWIENEGEQYWNTHIAENTHDIQMSRGAVHQYKMFGLFPIGDTVRQVGWWYHTDIETKKYWFGEPYGGPDTEIARPQFVENLENLLKQIEAALEDPTMSMVDMAREKLGGEEMTGEQIVPIMNALTNDVSGEYQVNVPNNGALEGLPDNVVVEVPAVVNGKGIQPQHVGTLPPKIMYTQIIPHWIKTERQLEAFKTGDKSMLLYNVLDVHDTKSYDQAVSVLDDLLAMKGNHDMKEYFSNKWRGR